MVPAIRNILGGFLFSGDDVYKKAGVLSGGERTRLAVARMLLRPSNMLVLDEPTNHLDLDSKDVLLDALMDYGGTLLFVSHDRYFVDRLATKVVEVGGGKARLYPGTYAEFLWSQANGGGVPQAVAAHPPRQRRPRARREVRRRRRRHPRRPRRRRAQPVTKSASAKQRNARSGSAPSRRSAPASQNSRPALPRRKPK